MEAATLRADQINATNQQRVDRGELDKVRTIRPYACKDCNQYHLTSLVKYKFKYNRMK